MITATIAASAEVARMVRLFNFPLGIALLATPFVYETDWLGFASSVIGAALLIGMSFRRGPVKNRYGRWNSLVV